MTLIPSHSGTVRPGTRRSTSCPQRFGSCPYRTPRSVRWTSARSSDCRTDPPCRACNWRSPASSTIPPRIVRCTSCWSSRRCRTGPRRSPRTTFGPSRFGTGRSRTLRSDHRWSARSSHYPFAPPRTRCKRPHRQRCTARSGTGCTPSTPLHWHCAFPHRTSRKAPLANLPRTCRPRTACTSQRWRCCTCRLGMPRMP